LQKSWTLTAEERGETEPAEWFGAAIDGRAVPGQARSETEEPLLSNYALGAALAGTAWLSLSWREIIALVWLTSSLGWFAWTILYIYRFQRLLGHARPAPAELQTRVQH